MKIFLMPDNTFFVQAVVFLSVLTGLSFLVFKPLQKIFERRKEETAGLIKKAAHLEESARNLSTNYEDAINRAFEEGASIREQALKRAFAEEAKIKDEARKDIGNILNSAKKELSLEKEKLLVQLKKDVPAIAEEIANKIR